MHIAQRDSQKISEHEMQIPRGKKEILTTSCLNRRKNP